MTDLQLGLLLIGAAAVAGVLVYNRVQERGVRRQAERSFGSQHADVLLDQPVAAHGAEMDSEYSGKTPQEAPRPSTRAVPSDATPRGTASSIT